MGTGHLTIDLGAVTANWRALDAMSGDSVRTGAVVKADGYGLGAGRIAHRLAQEGVREFYVAQAEEGATVRSAIGDGPEIFVFSGHMAGDAEALSQSRLIPLLNSIEQMTRHFETLGNASFGVQLDTGMNRLGIEPADWDAARSLVLPMAPKLIMSHLACADDPNDAMNARQLKTFREMTDGLDAPLSLSATGGILLGAEYHFDATRPGIGLYGGLPYADAQPVVGLSVPVIQVRTVGPGELVGYGGAWQADEPRQIATLQAGYADGLIRAMGDRALVYAGERPCPLAGRVSMDMLTVDVTHLETIPDNLDLLCAHQGVDDLAQSADTIGYEILTSLGTRYRRSEA